MSEMRVLAERLVPTVLHATDGPPGHIRVMLLQNEAAQTFVGLQVSGQPAALAVEAQTWNGITLALQAIGVELGLSVEPVQAIRGEG